jgi:hypothetical protein
MSLDEELRPWIIAAIVNEGTRAIRDLKKEWEMVDTVLKFPIIDEALKGRVLEPLT